MHDAAKVRYRIEQMDCPTEEQLIRNRLSSHAGIVALHFNLLARELTVHHRLPGHESIESALRDIGMGPLLLEAGARPEAPGPALSRRQIAALMASGGAALLAETLAWQTGAESSAGVAALAAVSMALVGWPTLRKGGTALRHLTLNIYFLMSLAVAGALALGKWSEASMVVFLFALAEAIEALSLERARHAIQSLSAFAPDTADVWREGHWQTTRADEVHVGERLRVRAGERAALDARVVQGNASFDEAPITGESLPVDKHAGDTLFAGSIATDGIVEAEVTAAAGDSTLARIASAIQDAQSRRAPTQRFVDAFARRYTPAVVLLAIAVAVIGPVVTGGGWSTWLYQALVMLVIACPCALVVSTPITVVSGLAAAARLGIVVKGGQFLEDGYRLKAIAFDKTGTLTEGRPELVGIHPVTALDETTALHIAASLDAASAHPIAKAIVRAWNESGTSAPLLPVEAFRAHTGLGVSGVIHGRPWQLVRHEPARRDSPAWQEANRRAQAAHDQGRTTVVLLDTQGEPAAVLAVADTIRPSATQAVGMLRQRRLHVALLTGDNEAAAHSVASVVGIDDPHGKLMPQDKVTLIEQLARKRGPVGMVGDGVNDAPALARASIGFAMGAAGTATALETADVAIMDDDPRKVPLFLALSQATVRVLKQNIALALVIKAAFLALAFAGMATLWMAVFADMGASLIVVFNGLRLLREQPGRHFS